MITLSYDGSNIKLYLNGSLVSQTAWTSGYTSTYGHLTNLTIGTNSHQTPSSIYQYYGKIDDIRFYNRALSNSEIQQLYNATK